MPEKIIPVNIATQYKNDYKLYAIYVCRERVTVDLRDGLKPVARRLLFATFELKSRTKYPNQIKSAKIVGDTMGAYHPHGDSSSYGAMKPMANDFEISVPLLNPHGNWGNKFGDDPAAMRYTEAGLSQFAQEVLLADLYETPNCVDWINNFDSTCKLPECFPAAVPLALVEGTFGIAVGFKVEIPSHNLSEVINATISLIKNRDAHIVLIPDHCQPCEIVESNFENISNIGMGNYTVRGIMEDGTNNGNPAIFIKSAPDMVYFDSIKKKIEEMIASKKLINVTSIDYDSDLIITLKQGSDVNYVKQLIYQNTGMEMSCRVNFEVLDNMIPMRMSYKAYILQWLEFRKFTKFRVYCNRLQQVNTRLHQIEPYVKVARSKDIISVIELIRSRKVPEVELIELLIKKFNITDIQAKFLLNIKLKELSEEYFNSYVDEYNKLTNTKNHYIDLVTNDNAIEEDIISELTAIKNKYKVKRRCKIVSKAEATGIPTGDFKVIITKNNFIRKLPMNENIPSLKNDNVKFILKGDNAENILIFTDTGKVFKYPIHKVPFADRRSNGVDIRLLIKNCTSNINAVMYEPVIKEFIGKMRKYYIVTLSNAGYIKKMDMEDFLSANMSGLIYAKVDTDDYIKDVMIISDSSDVVVYSTNKAIRFSMTAVPYLKRATRGNKTMSTDVDGLSIIKSDTTDIIVVTKKGYINRFIPAALAPADRTSAPSKVIKLTKGDEIVSVIGLHSNDTLVVNTTSGPVEILVDNIPVGSSIGGGTKMISNKTDTIVSCKFIHNK